MGQVAATNDGIFFRGDVALRGMHHLAYAARQYTQSAAAKTSS